MTLPAETYDQELMRRIKGKDLLIADDLARGHLAGAPSLSPLGINIVEVHNGLEDQLLMHWKEQGGIWRMSC